MPADSRLPDAVFKAYDIRGVVPGQIDTRFARLLGRALGRRARERGIEALVVGYDGRLSSPELAQSLQEGILSEGTDTIDIGMAPTPLMYFATHVLKTGSGVAITGSHNPPEYNGFKMMMAGETLHSDGIAALKRDMAALPSQARGPAGARRTMDMFDAYVRRICDDVKLARPMKIAVDCGNGVGGVLAARLFEALGCRVDPLFCDVDGRFPNHHPDPLVPENLQDLKNHLAASDCELGLALDGDADRLGAVTRGGEIIWPDRQLILFARDVLRRQPGATIIHDVKCSRHVGQAVLAAGGKPLMWQTGHSLMKAKLAETGAPLAGELSGHVFFKERWFGFDDGLYTGARLLEILSRHPDPSAVLQALPTGISTPEMKLDMREGEPRALIERLRTEADFPTSTQRVTIDGVRAEYPDGFGLARASNTTPSITLRFEGDTAQALERIQGEFRQALHTLAPAAKLPF